MALVLIANCGLTMYLHLWVIVWNTNLAFCLQFRGVLFGPTLPLSQLNPTNPNIVPTSHRSEPPHDLREPSSMWHHTTFNKPGFI
jgi:hypothetical protein